MGCSDITPGDIKGVRGGRRSVQAAASSNGAVRRDRPTSGGILLEAAGNFLWPTEMTADAPMRAPEPAPTHYVQGNLESYSSEPLEPCATGRAQVSLSLLHQPYLPGLHSLYWQLPHVHPHIALERSGCLLKLMFKSRPTDLHEMPRLAETAQDQ